MNEIRRGIDLGLRGVRAADQIDGKVAAKIPGAVSKEYRECAPETLVAEQPEEGCFGHNICKPKYVFQAHRSCSA